MILKSVIFTILIPALLIASCLITAGDERSNNSQKKPIKPPITHLKLPSQASGNITNPNVSTIGNDSDGLGYVPGEIIIKFRSDVADKMSLSESVNGLAVSTLSFAQQWSLYYGEQTGRESTSYVLVDNSQLNGWPQETILGGASYNSSIVTGDLDNDGFPEVVTGSNEGILYVWRYDGSVMEGWPKYVGEESLTPALADLDNDGDLEIVIGTNAPYQLAKLFVFHHDGRYFEGEWPKGWGTEYGWEINYISRAPVIADLDSDGDLEVIVNGEDRKMHAWHHDGSNVSGWPVGLYNGQSGTAVAVGDIDADGDMEIVAAETGTTSGVEYWGNIYVWNSDGTIKSGWPIDVDGTHYQPVLGDVNGDGTLEIIVSSQKGLSVFDVQGNLLFYKQVFGLRIPCLGDLNNDGIPEIIVSADYWPSNIGYLYAWHGDGSDVQGWPVALGNRRTTYGVVVGDVDGDREKEVIFGVRQGGHYKSYLYVVNHDGTFANGYPMEADISDFSVPVLTDLDRDGDIEIVGHGNYLGRIGTKLYVWDLSGEYNEKLIDWPMIGRNAQHGALFANPMPLDAVILDFGSGTGIWSRWEGGRWTQLHSHSARIITFGKIDGN